MSDKGQFWFAYFTPAYDSTVEFFRDGLELPTVGSWDRGSDDRGTLFAAASGTIEVLARPKNGDSSHLFDGRPPQGAFMVIETTNVDERYRRIVQKGLPITQALTDQPWHHRSFCVSEPNGLVLYFYEEIPIRE